MRDHFFFLLAGILASIFVLMALQPWAERLPTGPWSCGNCSNPEDALLDGEGLHRFVPGNYDGLQIIQPEGGGAPVLRITRQAEEQYENPLSGPHVVLREDLEYAFEDRKIEIIITARSAGGYPAEKFEANYYAKPDGESGWKDFPLTGEFADYSFEFGTPPRGAITSYDYLAIRPVVPDKHSTMEVKSIRIHAIGPKPTPG